MTATLLATLLVSFAPSANAAKASSCPSSITACGCTITTKGTYTVANALDQSQGLTPHKACIEIKADHSVLELKGNTLTGSGSGIGIYILKSADHSIVEGADPGDNGVQGAVNNWDIGIRDEANNCVIELFRQIDNNTTAGVLLDGVQNTLVDGFISGNNQVAGVIIQNGGHNRLSNFTVQGNTAHGVWVNSSNTNTLTTFTSTNNGNGVWLQSSDENSLYDCGEEGNNNVGVLIGCGSQSPPGTKCGKKSSDNNHISVSGANDNSVGGIVIEAGAGNNSVSNTKDQGNGGLGDVVDLNANCDGNIWTNNTFDNKSQACIN